MKNGTNLYSPDVGERNTINILFTGDAHFSPAYTNPHVFDDEIQTVCRRHNYVVINVESPITMHPPRDPPFTKNPILHSDPNATSALETMGNLVFNLANNHAFDHGAAGLRDTIEVAKVRGWSCIGAGDNIKEASAPCIIRKDNISIGLLSVSSIWVPFADETTPGVFGHTPERRVREAIRELKRQTRWVVVVYHGGEEYVHIPMPARRKRLKRYLQYGADVVVSHHAHNIQGYELFGDKMVFYGLGNLVFDMQLHRNFAGTDESVLLSLSFTEQTIDFLPFFTRQDREHNRVIKSDPSPYFTAISPHNYQLKWQLESGRRFDKMWRVELDNPPRSAWRRFIAYYYRRLRRIGAMIKLLRHENLRPFIAAGIKHRLRKCFRCHADQPDDITRDIPRL